MGMTMSQKILAAHAGLDEVKAGQLINAQLDMVLGNDVTSPVAINVFEENGAAAVFDNTKIAMIMDHFTPNKDIKAATLVKQTRNFANKYDIKNFMDVGMMGIEHALLPEKGLVGPGCLCIGADSHTCTYGALGAFSTGVGSTDMAAGMISGKAWFKVPSAIRFELVGKPQGYVSGKDVILHIIGMIGVDGALYKSMEFTGEGIQYLNMDDRLCIANMAIEAGAKNGIFPVDDITREYCTGRYQGTPVEYTADEDAVYDEVYTIDLSTIRPTVAFPHLPENTKTVDEIGENEVKIDQCVIGSCTNGRISDLRAAAEIFKGRKIAKGVRCIIIPGTQNIWLQAMHEGLFDIFVEAGAVVSTPTCGPCLGGHMGILAAGEKAVSTTNRNFVGRMGHVESFGDNVDTDVIIPARYLNTASHKELAAHCMEDIDAQFVNKVQEGDIMVAEKNFGCGSSREHAPIAIKASGISCVIASTFARIFYRNAINIGLPILECDEAAKEIKDGDTVSVNFDTGVITNETTGKTYQAEPFPEFIQNIIQKGGLINSIL